MKVPLKELLMKELPDGFIVESEPAVGLVLAADGKMTATLSIDGEATIKDDSAQAQREALEELRQSFHASLDRIIDKEIAVL